MSGMTRPPIPRPDCELLATLPDGCPPIDSMCPTADGRLMVTAGTRLFLVSMGGEVREALPAGYEAGHV